MERVPEYSARFELTDKKRDVIQSGDCKVILNERTMTITPQNSDLIIAPYFQILGIKEGDYKVGLELDNNTLNISQLGYDYENFLKNLYRLRGELLLRYTLMNEAYLGKGIEAHYTYRNAYGATTEGECEARVYESAAVALPEKADPIRLPLCYITSQQREDYRVIVSAESGESITLSQMGEKTDFFIRILSKAISDAQTRAQDLLRTLTPNVPADATKRVATLMMDGKAASSSEINAISPQLWQSIEEAIKQVDLGDGYEYLKELSPTGKISVGVKRGLMGEKTGQYIWFMAPIYDAYRSKPGNVLVLEAASDEAASRATYAFRMIDKERYSSAAPNDLEEEVDKFKQLMNRCLIEINFRREPIYLTEEKLLDPEYERYLYASKKMESLQLLRKNFLGRIFHNSPEKWREDLNTLIREKT
jgi:hypothetical protein